MKTNVELEFINNVLELSKKMRNLTIFWQSNLEELENLNVGKDYPFSKSFDELTFNVNNWLLALINDYHENLQE